MADKHDYTKAEKNLIHYMMKSVIEMQCNALIINDSGIVSDLRIRHTDDIDRALLFLGYGKRDKVLVIDDDNKDVGLIHLANKEERTGDEDDMIIKTEAAPRIKTRPKMWAKRKDCQEVVDDIIRKAYESICFQEILRGGLGQD